MSVIYPWPTAFVKQWILPISNIIGITPDGRELSPLRQQFSANFLYGTISAAAWFIEPITAIYGYSRFRNYYTDPIYVGLDYPVMGIFFTINVRP